MDPVSRVICFNYTLTLCSRVYPKPIEIDNGSWVSYAKQLKLIRAQKRIRETGVKYATLNSLDNTGGGFFKDKDLRDSKLMKCSRKAKTGREVFLGQNGEYAHDQFYHIGSKVPPYSWYYFPWFAKLEKKIAPLLGNS